MLAKVSQVGGGGGGCRGMLPKLRGGGVGRDGSRSPCVCGLVLLLVSEASVQDAVYSTCSGKPISAPIRPVSQEFC